MPPYKEQGCCDTGCGCNIENPKSLLECPQCRQYGEQVSNLTVYSLTQKAYKSDIERKGTDHFNICLNPECECVYYNEEKTVFHDQLKTPFHLKNSAATYMVCYCLNITKEEIIDAVHNKKLTGMKDIMRELKGEPPCMCEKNNPTGLCCEEAFNTIIKEAIASYRKA